MGGKGSGGGGGGFVIRGANGQTFGGTGGGGGGGADYSGGRKNIGAWNPGGGTVSSYNQSGATRPDGTSIGSDNGEPSFQDMPRGGIPNMSPQARQVGRNMARDFMIGTILGGPAVGVAAAGHAAYRGSGTQGGSGELDPNDALDRQILDRLSGGGNSRANMRGRPLSAGQIPMRPGSSYGRYPSSGPPLRRGSSLLGDDDDDAGSNLGGGPTSADLNDFSF